MKRELHTFSVTTFGGDFYHATLSARLPFRSGSALVRVARNGHVYAIPNGQRAYRGSSIEVSARLRRVLENLYRRAGLNQELPRISEHGDYGWTDVAFALWDALRRGHAVFEVTSDPTTNGNRRPIVRLADGRYYRGGNGYYLAEDYAFHHSPHPRWLTDGATFSSGTRLRWVGGKNAE